MFFLIWSQNCYNSTHYRPLSPISKNVLTILNHVFQGLPFNSFQLIFNVWVFSDSSILLFFQNITAMLLLRCCHRLTRACPFNTQRYSPVPHIVGIVYFSLQNIHGFSWSFTGLPLWMAASHPFYQTILKRAHKHYGYYFASQAPRGTCVGIVRIPPVEQQRQQRRRGSKVVPRCQLETCPCGTSGWHRGRSGLQPPSP